MPFKLWTVAKMSNDWNSLIFLFFLIDILRNSQKQIFSIQYCTLSVFRQIKSESLVCCTTFLIMLPHTEQVKMKTTQFQVEYNDTISSGKKVQLTEERRDRQLKEIVSCPFQFINIVWCRVTASAKFSSALGFLCINLHCALLLKFCSST